MTRQSTLRLAAPTFWITHVWIYNSISWPCSRIRSINGRPFVFPVGKTGEISRIKIGEKKHLNVQGGMICVYNEKSRKRGCSLNLNVFKTLFKFYCFLFPLAISWRLFSKMNPQSKQVIFEKKNTKDGRLNEWIMHHHLSPSPSVLAPGVGVEGVRCWLPELISVLGCRAWFRWEWFQLLD